MFKSIPFNAATLLQRIKPFHLLSQSSSIVVRSSSHECCLLNFIYSYFTFVHDKKAKARTREKEREREAGTILLKCRETDGFIQLEILHFELIILFLFLGGLFEEKKTARKNRKKISSVQLTDVMNVAEQLFFCYRVLISGANDAILLQHKLY